LNISNGEDFVAVHKIIGFLDEDIGFGDITTAAIIDPETRVEASIICQEDAVISGIEEASLTFSILQCTGRKFVKEGEVVRSGKMIFKVVGRASSILKGERTALNILGRMSGVATATRKMIEKAAEIDPRIRIAATRKTLPGFRLFDKKAVRSGGGDTHRFRLDDAVLIKDNHIQIAGSIDRAVRDARRTVSFAKKIEAEASSLEEALDAAKAGADIIMLDNLSPKQMFKVAKTLRDNGLRNEVLLEASGGITLENVGSYCLPCIDILSSGEITHSARSINFTLGITKVNRKVVSQ
jgi:nicotinate-nucleotide pyrophosphorylase (carboxylating)